MYILVKSLLDVHFIVRDINSLYSWNEYNSWVSQLNICEWSNTMLTVGFVF